MSSLHRLLRLLPPHADFGVGLQLFTLEEVNLLGHQFTKLAWSFTHFADANAQRELLNLGVQKGYFGSPQTMASKQFTEFCLFLKTWDGKRSVRSTQKRLELVRRAGPELDISAATAVAVLSHQRQLLAIQLKKRRPSHANY